MIQYDFFLLSKLKKHLIKNVTREFLTICKGFVAAGRSPKIQRGVQRLENPGKPDKHKVSRPLWFKIDLIMYCKGTQGEYA